MHVQHIIVIVLLSALILPVSISMISNNQLPTTGETTYHYDVSTENTDLDIDDDNFAVVEYVNASSILIGDTINCVDLMISKIGTITGNSEIGVFDSNGDIVTTWAIVDVSTFTDTATFYTYCFTDYTIQNQDRIGIRYDFASADDNLLKQALSTSDFDGENTIAQRLNFALTWDDFPDTDLTMRLYFVGGATGNFDSEAINNLMMVFILLMVVLVLILLIRLFFNE